MENRNYEAIAANAQMPYVNGTLIPQGILLRNSHGVTHPSEPNYIALFSGSTRGVSGDPCPIDLGNAPNLASELIAAGKTFTALSESMPRDGFTGCSSALLYARKHNPWVNFSNVPASSNVVYDGWPASGIANVVWIIPNLCHDMHDCPARVGDAWLAKNLPPILAWDAKNDGLLIVTWDEAEPDQDGTNHIATILAGPMVKTGVADMQRIDHYGILHTIETIFGLPCIAKDCQAPVLAGIWK